ncbi:hypothetical protein AB0P15_38025 [Streptomyces sp. NPDC087917]|uniref:hypothetical protein n=1 Tax=Streptomyces sp. NPDC087917 TaxID=3155060 RepID=UPI003414FFE4
MRRTPAVFLTATVLLGALAPAAAADDDVFNGAQLIKGGNASSFSKNYGRSVDGDLNFARPSELVTCATQTGM